MKLNIRVAITVLIWMIFLSVVIMTTIKCASAQTTEVIKTTLKIAPVVYLNTGECFNTELHSGDFVSCCVFESENEITLRCGI